MDSGPAIKISGVVHRPDGTPAAKTSVRLVGGYQSREDGLQTDANGKFEVEWSPRQFGGQGEPTTCLLVRDVEHNLAVAQDLDEDTTNLDLTLAPGLTLVGPGGGRRQAAHQCDRPARFLDRPQRHVAARPGPDQHAGAV